METPEAVPPESRPRHKWPITEILDQLRELTVLELADVAQHVKHIRAARGDRPSPELVSQVVAIAGRLHLTHAYHVPLPLIRAGLVDVPRTLLDAALFDAESRGLLRMEPVDLPSPFVEVGAGIPHKRGLLYWIVPFGP
ncbi:MAG TPA: hypothetical protein PK156_37010 [Polyangium sp.]|nr:hypothetical protein [Polyangium sp.]